jgi:hypothetical protein
MKALAFRRNTCLSFCDLETNIPEIRECSEIIKCSKSSPLVKKARGETLGG